MYTWYPHDANRPTSGSGPVSAAGAESDDARMTPRDRMERWQRIGRQVLEKLDALRLTGEADEYFYQTLRDAFVEAGATDAEIEVMAQFLITLVVEQTAAHSEARMSQFELITDHIACTTVRIRLSHADTVLLIDFPDRPRTH